MLCMLMIFFSLMIVWRSVSRRWEPPESGRRSVAVGGGGGRVDSFRFLFTLSCKRKECIERSLILPINNIRRFIEVCFNLFKFKIFYFKKYIYI